MKFHLIALLIILIGLSLFISCGDDDDDDVSSGDDDTLNDDDDDDNDIADDDASDDDDTTDDDDDDTVDYSLEPLAVLECQALCADVGEELVFDSSESEDPSGSSLEYYLEFGDGYISNSVVDDHAYANPGTYKAVLTVTNEAGLTDSSHCIIAVGDLPQGQGQIDEVSFVPNWYDERISEPKDTPEHGGLIYAFFNAQATGIVDQININGVSGFEDGGLMEWCEVVNDDLAAGDVGALRCQSYSEDIEAGEQVSIEILSGSTVIWSKNATLPDPALTPSYITASVDKDELFIHVRNDYHEDIELTGLSIDGIDVSNYVTINEPLLEPGRTAIIRVPYCDGFDDYHRFIVYSAHGQMGKQAITVSRTIRLFHQVFFISGWTSEEVLSIDARRLQYQARGINAFKYDAFDTLDPDQVIALAETEDFYLWSHTKRPEGSILDFLADYGDHPRYLGTAVSGEGDLGNNSEQEALEKAQAFRYLDEYKQPTWIYNACMFAFPSWGPIADVGGMDHYCVWRPKCNTYMFPPFYTDYIERSGQYAYAIKRAAEPKPVWNWTQGLNNTSDFRCTTADEMRSQWYLVLSQGTKGMLWFSYKDSYEGDCPAADLDEVSNVAMEVWHFDDILLEGDVATYDSVVRTEAVSMDVTATVAPDSVVVFLTNLWYQFNWLAPYQWYTRHEIIVEFEPPEGFEPAAFYLVDGDTETELEFEKIGPGVWEFTVPELKVSAAVVVEPEP